MYFILMQMPSKAKKVLWRHQKIWWIYYIQFSCIIFLSFLISSECSWMSHLNAWNFLDTKLLFYIIFLFPIYTLMFLFGGNDSQLQGREWRPQELPAQLSELTIYFYAGKRQTVDFVSHSPSPCLWSQKYPWFLHKHHYCSALL